MMIGGPAARPKNDFDTFDDAAFYENGAVKLFNRRQY